jgi:hypothetical protein
MLSLSKHLFEANFELLRIHHDFGQLQTGFPIRSVSGMTLFVQTQSSVTGISPKTANGCLAAG